MPDAPGGLRRRWQRTGLQTRVTLLAGAAVAVALLAGSLLLVGLLRAGLTGAVDDRAEQRLVEVERLVAEQRLPAVLPAADPTVLDATDQEGLARALAPADRTTTVIVRGDCPEGAHYATLEC